MDDDDSDVHDDNDDVVMVMMMMILFMMMITRFWTDSYAKPAQEGIVSVSGVMIYNDDDDDNFSLHLSIFFHSSVALFIYTTIHLSIHLSISPTAPLRLHQVHPTVQKLMDMGFAQSQAQQALLDSKGDENLAIEMLLSG